MKRDPHVLLAALVEEVRVRSDGGAGFCSITVAPGDQAIFDFGAESCGGAIWTRLSSANLTRSFPTMLDTMSNCAATAVYHAEIGILRPGAVPDTTLGGEVIFPSDEELFLNSQDQLKDMQVMLEALQAIGSDYDDFIIQNYIPIGPDGGVVGGTWAFIFGEE